MYILIDLRVIRLVKEMCFEKCLMQSVAISPYNSCNKIMFCSSIKDKTSCFGSLLTILVQTNQKYILYEVNMMHSTEKSFTNKHIQMYCIFHCSEICESLTCAGDASKHPALAIFNRLHPGLAPLSEDRHAAGPPIRCDSIRVRLLPATGQHAPVTVRVHLDRWRQHVEETSLKL